MPTSTICWGSASPNGFELAGAAGIAGHRQHVAILLGQGQQRVGELFEIRAAHLQAELLRHAAGPRA